MTTSRSISARPGASSTATSARSSTTTVSRCSTPTPPSARSGIRGAGRWCCHRSSTSGASTTTGSSSSRLRLFCVWLALLFGIVRRRLGRLPALGVTACVGTAPIFLLHTDQLLSEYAYFVAIAVVIWWFDRVHRSSDLVRAPHTQLAVLGVLMSVAFNVRREAVVLVVVVAVAPTDRSRPYQRRLADTPRRRRTGACVVAGAARSVRIVRCVGGRAAVAPAHGTVPRQREQPDLHRRPLGRSSCDADQTAGSRCAPAARHRDSRRGRDRCRHRRSATTDARHHVVRARVVRARSSSARTSVRSSGTGCR